MRFKIGVFGIIFDNKKRVLLCHRRDYDLWNLPGGGLEEGETPWEGVVREVKEETGLEVEMEKLTGIYARPDKNEIVLAFVCRIVGGELRKTEEADKLEYFSVDELPRNTIPKHVERIRDAWEFSGEVVMKVQKGPSVVELVRKGEL